LNDSKGILKINKCESHLLFGNEKAEEIKSSQA
jgi:hypothetical protein